MVEFASPALGVYDDALSIPGMLAERLAKDPDSVFLERSTGLGGTWVPMTVKAFVDQANAVAKGLAASGIEVGDRVGIMSRTRYEWTLLDFACWQAGAVGVPIYETSSAEQVKWIAADAGIRLVVVETPGHFGVLSQVRDELPELVDVLVIDEDAVGAFKQRGEAAGVTDEEIDRRSKVADGSTLATIIYTSGTTGRPKGAELTHGNFVSLAREGVASLREVCAMPYSRTLLFMPLAHVFARFIEVLSVTSGAVLGHTPDTRNLLADLATFQPTFVLAVPRVFEKVYNSAEQKAGSGIKLQLFRWAAKVAITYSRALDDPKGPGVGLKAQHSVAGALVHTKLRHALGGKAEFAISGGAPLGERLGHFYRGIGVRILEGYGLTETTAPTAVNRPEKVKIGTVGPAFSGTALKVDDEGSIWVMGPHVFRGYRGMPEETAKVLVDGWFETGDLGALDEDGYLRITGRKKEIIVTAGGKNVAPALLEDRFRGHPLVSQVVVVGDQKPFIGALVTLDVEMLPGWLSMHGLPPMDAPTASRDPRVLAALDRAAERASQVVSRAESIRKVRVLTTDFSIENGYLTPSLKVKRAQVLKDFAAEVEALYVDTRTGGGD
jgi:long-chain acyl-CoA synthetase